MFMESLYYDIHKHPPGASAPTHERTSSPMSSTKIWVVTDFDDHYVETFSDPRLAELKAKHYCGGRVREDYICDPPKDWTDPQKPELPRPVHKNCPESMDFDSLATKINQIIAYLEIRDGRSPCEFLT